jgi:hypothetical protein
MIKALIIPNVGLLLLFLYPVQINNNCSFIEKFTTGKGVVIIFKKIRFDAANLRKYAQVII